MATLLIVDDEKSTRDGLRMALEDEFDCYLASGIKEAMSILESEPIDLMLTDLRLAGDSGMDLLDQALAIPRPPVAVMMTAYGSVDTAVEAMRRGAWNFVTKPLNLNEVELLLKRALHSRSLEKDKVRLEHEVQELRQKAGSSKHGLESLIGKSPAMQKVSELVTQVAPTRATVLIEGESGTGKELVANAIHEYSPRSKNKIIAINCGAIPENLLESELFGHEKGAFTGAINRRAGLFEQCDGGTLFLDEIGDMPSPVQVKLLRVLQDGTFTRVGSNEMQKSDVRIVAATNKNLAEEVSKGHFREDLFYRLNVVEIHLPPLRARADDIPLLAEHFLQLTLKRNKMSPLKLSAEAMDHLKGHRWPGNVRELENTIARACALANNEVLLPSDIEFTKTYDDSSGEDAATTNALRHLAKLVPKGKSPGKWITEQLAKLDAVDEPAGAEK
ncbi:MAG: sigma-54-dependent transcriptional regulator [Akkermansiaceae bacterium]